MTTLVNLLQKLKLSLEPFWQGTAFATAIGKTPSVSSLSAAILLKQCHDICLASYHRTHMIQVALCTLKLINGSSLRIQGRLGM